MLGAVYGVVILVLLLGVTIFAHELGHFLVARACGMVVDVFSIGFGPALWKKKAGGITYKIGCIPFGGYVALPQLDPNAMSGIQGTSESEGGDKPPVDVPPPRNLPHVAPWKKILVSLAGGAGNVIFAVLIACFVYVFGRPATPADTSSEVGYIDEDSALYNAGVRIGDKIITINEIRVRNWSEVVSAGFLEKEVRIVAESAEGKPKKIVFPVEKGTVFFASMDGVRLSMVGSLMEGMSAEKIGIQPGDVITHFDGVRLRHRYQLQNLVWKSSRDNIPIIIDRRGEILEFNITPTIDEEIGRRLMGISFIDRLAFDREVIIHPTPWYQLKGHASMIFKALRGLVTPRTSGMVAGKLSGPVGIMGTYWILIKSSFMYALWFTGLLNINLAIINLLPIPVLDGGHIVFFSWELIMRRPIPPKIVNALVQFFAVLLIIGVILLTFKDCRAVERIKLLFGSKDARPAPEQVEAVKPESTNAPVLQPE